MGLGAKGSLVKKVQNFLASNGYTGETFTNDIQACATDENSCDGNYGTKTKKMVKKFQEDAEIKPDGIFGGQTYAAMFE
jgi:peptidoglycan hydrolase-like protein with peptidoglycan-binding domain